MSKLIKAISINPIQKTIEEVEIKANSLPPLYEHIGCQTIDFVCRMPKGDALIVDDEALLHEPQPPAFRFGYYPYRIHGIALVMGSDNKGCTTDPNYRFYISDCYGKYLNYRILDVLSDKEVNLITISFIWYMKPIRVLLADDHDIILDGLTALLETLEHIEVIGAVSNGIQALEFLESNIVDVVIADFQMPLLNGLGLNLAIRKRFPHVHVLMLTMMNGTDQIRDAIQSGVDGYILKNANKFELERAILSVAAGHKYFEHAVIQQLAQTAANNSNNLPQNELVPLTNREQEILVLISQGLTNSEIADKLFRSQLTIDTHRKNIFRKLGVNNVVELVHYAVRNGLVSNT